MNKFLLIGALTTTSALLYIAYLMYQDKNKSIIKLVKCPMIKKPYKCSLDDDLADVLAFIPFNEINKIIRNYAQHDFQTGRFITFINDTKGNLLEDLVLIPDLKLFLIFLRQNGLVMDKWQRQVTRYWDSLPTFQEEDLSLASGGLKALVDDILKEIPVQELHHYLCQKVLHSSSFRQLLMYLKSQHFANICSVVVKSPAFNKLQRSGAEFNLDVHIFNELVLRMYWYLTEIVWEQKEDYTF